MVTISCCESFTHLRPSPNTFSVFPLKKKKKKILVYLRFSHRAVNNFYGCSLVSFLGVSLVMGHHNGHPEMQGNAAGSVVAAKSDLGLNSSSPVT